MPATRAGVTSEYGSNYLNAAPKKYSSKVKNAQEAHEAIRPTTPYRSPQSLSSELNSQELALYRLIWQGTLASQMADATGVTVSVRLAANSTDRTTGEATDDGTDHPVGTAAVADIVTDNSTRDSAGDGTDLGPAVRVVLRHTSGRQGSCEREADERFCLHPLVTPFLKAVWKFPCLEKRFREWFSTGRKIDTPRRACSHPVSVFSRYDRISDTRILMPVSA